MSGTAKRTFELITDDPATTPPQQPAAPQTDETQAARQLLFTALRALSQRTLTAVTNLFSLFLVTLVFVLCGRILDNPTPERLEAGAGFAVFCLLIDVVRRRAK